MRIEASVDDMKKIEYGILKFIDQVCSKHNIRYYLAYGTLIGAIRHEGFIPWDDDIDIIMFREDYVKFSRVMENINSSPYLLLSVDTNNKFSLPFPKVCDSRTQLTRANYRKCMSFGIYVDILILDNVPDEENKRKLLFKKLNILHFCWEISQGKSFGSKKNPISVIAKVIIRIINPRVYSRLLNHVAQKYNSANTREVGNLLNNVFEFKHGIYPREAYGDGVRMKFEQDLFLVPIQYDYILTDNYGDYMQLPPLEQRVNKHDINALYDPNEYL